jgi:hypothetical protein
MDLVKKLKGEHFVEDRELVSQVAQMFNEIKENGQENGRDDKVILSHITSGVAIETVAAKLLDAEINRQVHDSRNPETFAYDLKKGDITFEVKPSNREDVWYNFNLREDTHKISKLLYRGDLTTFLKYKDYVDYLIVGYAERKMGGYLVGFKWIIEASSFEIWMKRSGNYSKGVQTTHFYHVKNAERAGVCFSI